jgi:hypothetical protein
MPGGEAKDSSDFDRGCLDGSSSAWFDSNHVAAVAAAANNLSDSAQNRCKRPIFDSIADLVPTCMVSVLRGLRRKVLAVRLP